MGLPVYMNYYSVHDEEQNRIGFVPHNKSDKFAVSLGAQPERVLVSTNPEDLPDTALSWIITIFLVLLFEGLMLWLAMTLIFKDGLT